MCLYDKETRDFIEENMPYLMVTYEYDEFSHLSAEEQEYLAWLEGY